MGQKGRRRAFTLIEIVFVISILGVLIALALPGFQSIRTKARKTQDMANLKKIAEAWQIFSESRGMMPPYTGCNDRVEFAAILAGLDGSKRGSVLNDANVYCSLGDKYASPLTSDIIGYVDVQGNEYYARPWERVDNALCTNHNEVLSYGLIQGVNPNRPRETLPIAFTRGLKENGLWDAKYGVYGSKGGFVAYADGHVTWYDGDQPVSFLRPDQSDYTHNLRELFDSDVWISCGSGDFKSIVGEDQSPLILSASGTGARWRAGN